MHSLHHLALGARDVAGLARFYRDAFHLEQERQFFYEDGRLRSVWLKMGTIRLMIEHTVRTRPIVEGVDKGLFLLAFSVSDEERSKMEQRLEGLGCPTLERTEFSSYARDPEGNRFAISHFPVPAAESGVQT